MCYSILLLKKRTKNSTECFWHSTGFPCGLSVLCVFLCVWLSGINTRLSCAVEETVDFLEWTAQFYVLKTTGKDSYKACGIACQNCAVYPVFPSGMTSHSKIAQFNWQCIGRFKKAILKKFGKAAELFSLKFRSDTFKEQFTQRPKVERAAAMKHLLV
jgi:hypothetical protein